MNRVRFCFVISFLEIDSKTEEAIEIASLPETLMMAIAPAPEGVAKATIVSCESIKYILYKDSAKVEIWQFCFSVASVLNKTKLAGICL